MVIYICDNEPSVCQSIAGLLESEYGDRHELNIFSDLREMLEFARCEQNSPPDILLSDIELDSENGIENARQLSLIFSSVRIIFITGFAEKYMQDVFLSVKPFGYLRKPVQRELLIRLINKAIAETEQSVATITVYNNGVPVDLPQNKILYFEINRRTLSAHTLSNDYSLSTKIESLPEVLQDSFIRCHKSYIVNADYIRQIDGELFCLSNGIQIKISRQYLNSAKTKYYMIKSM